MEFSSVVEKSVDTTRTMSAMKYLEELIYKFLTKRLTDAEKRNLDTGYDAERYIDEETEDEMRHEIFEFVKSRVLWGLITSRLRDEADDDDDEENPDDDESSDEYE